MVVQGKGTVSEGFMHGDWIWIGRETEVQWSGITQHEKMAWAVRGGFCWKIMSNKVGREKWG